MKILNLYVTGQNITLQDSNVIMSGSQDYLGLKFKFGSDWEQYNKAYRFIWQEEAFTAIELDGIVKVPHEVIKPPHFIIAVGGSKGTEFVPTAALKIPVKENGYGDPDAVIDESEPASASLLAQLLELCEGKIEGVMMDGVDLEPDGNKKVNVTNIPKSALAEEVQTELSDLSARFETEHFESRNLLNPDELYTGGTIWITGVEENPSYNYTGFVPVSEGQSIYVQAGGNLAANRQNKGMRFVVAYDDDKRVIISASSSVEGLAPYTVPGGVSYIRITAYKDDINADNNPVILASETGDVEDYIPYFEPYEATMLKEEYNNDRHTKELIVEENREIRGELSKLSGCFETKSSEDTNLLNPNSLEHFWYANNGTKTYVGDGQAASYENLVCIPNAKYILSSDTEVFAMQFNWFDSNGIFIGRVNKNDFEGGECETIATSPQNAATMSVGFFVKNSTITPEYAAENGFALYKYRMTAVDRIARSKCSAERQEITVIDDWKTSDWVDGGVNASNGSFDATMLNRISTGFKSLTNITSIKVTVNADYSQRCTFFTDKLSFIYTEQQYAWKTGTVKWTIPPAAVFYRIVVKKTDDSSLHYDDDTGCTVTKTVLCHKIPVNSLARKSISILGDSISTFAGIGNYATAGNHSTADGTYTYSGNACRYPQVNLLQNVEDTYWMKLIRHFDMKLKVNESIAGSTVSGSGNSIISSMARIGHLGNNGTPDVILVNAGTNDIGHNVSIGTFDTSNPLDLTEAQIQALDTSTFANAYRAMIIRLQYYYPDAKIIVLLPNYTSAYYSPNEADEYNEIIKEVCDYFGVFWIDARTSGITMFNRASYLPDGIHYNSAGMELIYQNLKNVLEMRSAL